MKDWLKRKEIADAEGDVSRDRTPSGKISGLIVLEKFFDAARNTLASIYPADRDVDDYGSEADEDTKLMCDIERDDNTCKDTVILNDLRIINLEHCNEEEDIEDVVIHVAFCDPLKSKDYTAEVVVLGSQTLADVRSSFRCLTEYAYEDKVSDEGSEGPEASYFYIEGLFYVDQSSALSRKCAESVVSWAESFEDLELSSFIKWPPRAFRDMGSAKIRSMCIRINYPYIFSHGGVCNHTVYFRKVYFYNSRFHPRLPRCPFVSYLPSRLSPKCTGCRQNLSSYITVDDTFADEDTAFWCKRCFEMFHLKSDNTPSHKYKMFYLSPRIREFLEFEKLYRGGI